MSTKRTCGVCPVAKKMWSTNINGEAFVEKKPLREWPSFSVWMLDLSTPEKFDAAVESAARELNSRASGKEFGPFFMDVDRQNVVAVLAALGITRPRQTKETTK